MTPSRKALGRSLARRQPSSFAAAALRNEIYKKSVISKVASLVKVESANLCSIRNPSKHRSQDLDVLTSVNWLALYEELETRTPVLVAILLGALGKAIKAKVTEQQKIAVCMASSVLLYMKNPHMSLIQRVVAMILYAGHASKSVYRLATACMRA